MRPALLLLFAAVASGQTLLVTEGDWVFRISNAADFTLRIVRTTDGNFSGAYAGQVIMQGQRSSASSLTVAIRWLYASSNIPGSNLPYFAGALNRDGNSMSGTYGSSSSQTAGNWSAAVVNPVIITPPPSTGSTVCDQKTLSGGYGYLLSGTVAGSSVSIIGSIATDANGNAGGSQFVMIDGQLQKRALTARYTVSANCLVLFEATDDLGTPATYIGSISAGGKTIQLMQTDAGAKVSGTAYQQ